MTTSNNADKYSPIAFFDSGVGGLTVLNKVRLLLPNENFIYYGDTLHVPYGEKTKEQLLEYSLKILDFFESKNCKAVVMACNTTSSVIYEDIKDKYNFKLYPIVQSVTKILSKMPITRLGVFATSATVSSNVYQNEIAKYNPNIKVYAQHCPGWVKIVENNLLNDKDSISIIKNDLEKMLVNNPEKIVLGCTHYPFLLKILSQYASESLFIDPAIYFAEFIKNDLKNSDLLNHAKSAAEEFYVSSNPLNFQTAAKLFYNIKNEPRLLTF